MVACVKWSVISSYLGFKMLAKIKFTLFCECIECNIFTKIENEKSVAISPFFVAGSQSRADSGKAVVSTISI